MRQASLSGRSAIGRTGESKEKKTFVGNVEEKAENGIEAKLSLWTAMSVLNRIGPNPEDLSCEHQLSDH